jgi:hypothetical protein
MKTSNKLKRKATGEKKEIKKDISETYNEFKKFEGKDYTGMKLGEVINGTMIKENGKRKK